MKNIKQEDFDDIINKDELTVVDFFATWCMPCRMLKPILEKIEQERKDIKFYELDVQECEQIAMRYRIFSVPTIVCFKNGKKIDSLVGANPYEDVLAFLDRAANTNVD